LRQWRARSGERRRGRQEAARGIHAFFAGQIISGPVQASRLGVKGGPPIGSGFDKPIRVPELEEEFYAQEKNKR